MKASSAIKQVAFLLLCGSCFVLVLVQNFLTIIITSNSGNNNNNASRRSSGSPAAAVAIDSQWTATNHTIAAADATLLSRKDTGDAQEGQAQEDHWPLRDQEEEGDVGDDEGEREDNVKTVTTSARLFKPKLRLSNHVIDRLSETVYMQLLQLKSGRLLNLTNVSYPIEHSQLIECEPTAAAERRRMAASDAREAEQETGSNEEHANGDDDRGNTAGLGLLIMVNSKWSNFERRRKLRASWLNKWRIHEQVCGSQRLRQLQRPKGQAKRKADGSGIIDRVEYMFVLGSGGDGGDGDNGTESGGGQPQIDSRVRLESAQHLDLLVMGLRENYHSLSMKHLALLKWAAGAEAQKISRTLVLKCDDDAQVDLSQLVERFYAKKMSLALSSPSSASSARRNPSLEHDGGDNENKNATASANAQENGPSSPSSSRQWQQQQQQHNWIMCARFPGNTRVLRRPNRKWRLTRQEYAFDTFPAYCSGLAYLAPLVLLRRLLVLAHVILWNGDGGGGGQQQRYERPLWVDDVFVTGVLAASLEQPARVERLNAHFCYTRAQQSRRAKLRLPCMVSEMM